MLQCMSYLGKRKSVSLFAWGNWGEGSFFSFPPAVRLKDQTIMLIISLF